MATAAVQDVTKPPKAIKFDVEVTDVSFHPVKELLAVGDMDGEVYLYSYSTTGENHMLMSFKSKKKKSCRAVSFTKDGSLLMTASSNKSFQVIDVEAGSVEKTFKKAHDDAIYSLLVVDRNIVATGDDDGTLKVWDLRHQRAIMEIKENEDCLTDMIIDSTKRLVLATSGDGTLTSFDIRKHKMKLKSENLNSGLQSLAAVKDSEKVVCGDEDGVLNFFNWGEWGNISDRFPGHPGPIDSIVPISDTIVCTGSEDGIRAVNLFPNRFMGIIGNHGNHAIENMSLSHCGQWLASCSHDKHVRFWGVGEVAKEKVDGHKRAKASNVFKVRTSERNEFYSDLVEDMTEKKDTEDDKKSEKSDADSDDADSDDADSDDADSGDSGKSDAGNSDSESDSEDSDSGAKSKVNDNSNNSNMNTNKDTLRDSSDDSSDGE